VHAGKPGAGAVARLTPAEVAAMRPTIVSELNGYLSAEYEQGGRDPGVPQGLAAYFAMLLPVILAALLTRDLTPYNRAVLERVGIVICIIFGRCRPS
jgi:hypothetical protein